MVARYERLTMSFQIVNQENENVLILSEDIGVAQASELHAALLPLALSDKPIAVQAQAVTSIHASIVQLLLSLKRSIPQFELRSPSPAMDAALLRLGLKAHFISPHAKPSLPS